MNSIGYLSVFHEAQKLGWVNPRSGGSLKTMQPSVGSKGFEFISVGELTAAPTPVANLIDGIFESEALGLLFAPPSAGKSFVSISMSTAIATGKDWLGRRTQQGAVFYLAGEGHAGLSRRLKAWEVHHGISLSEAPIFISKTPAALMNENSVQSVMEAIRALCSLHGRPRLIVIDTFARNMGDGDENSNADVGVFVNRIDQMRAEIGCAILLVHHTGHNATERARGASALHAAMDTVFRLDRTTSGMTLTHVKAKESELNHPIAVELQQVTLPGWLDANGDEMNSAVVVAGAAETFAGPPKLTSKEQEALDIFVQAAKEHGHLSLDGTMAGLTEDIWRREFYLAYPDGKSGSLKTAFGRAREKLVSKGRLGFVAEHGVYHFSGLDSFVYNRPIVEAIHARLRTGTGAQ